MTGLQATKYKPVTSYVNSVEINSVTGIFQFSVHFLFHDSVRLSNNVEIIAPSGYNVRLSQPCSKRDSLRVARKQ